MNEYLVKPVEPRDLAAALEKWLPRRDAAPGVAQADVFDGAEFLQRMMGDRDVARIVVGGFLTDMPKQLQALAIHIAAGDANACEQVAHAIRGAAATVSGNAFRDAAAAMEQSCQAGDLEGLSAMLPELERQWQILCRAIGGDQPDCSRQLHS